MTIFFVLSIFFWVVNRVYSAVKVWEISSLDGIKFLQEAGQDQVENIKEKALRARKWRALRTLCDVEIFEILKILLD